MTSSARWPQWSRWCTDDGTVDDDDNDINDEDDDLLLNDMTYLIVFQLNCSDHLRFLNISDS